MRAQELMKFATLMIEAKENFLVIGPPGVGKTSVINEVIENLRYDSVFMHPVVSDPTDYKGMPGFNKDGMAEFFAIGDLRKLLDAKSPLVCVIDDAGQAAPAVQAALMQLVWGGKINGHKISKFVRFVMLSNRRQDKAAVTGLITPLLDRMTAVVSMDYSVDDFALWYLQQRSPELPADLLTFVRKRPDLMDPKKYDLTAAAREMEKFPTPRSVAGLGRLVALGVDSLEPMQGAVGAGFAGEYLSYRRLYLKLPGIDEIYKNPTKVPVPDESDVLYALMMSLSYGLSEQTLAPTLTYLQRVPSEFKVVCMKDGLVRAPAVQKKKEFVKFAVENRVAFGYDGYVTPNKKAS